MLSEVRDGLAIPHDYLRRRPIIDTPAAHVFITKRCADHRPTIGIVRAPSKSTLLRKQRGKLIPRCGAEVALRALATRVHAIRSARNGDATLLRKILGIVAR
jgi:hypothetical protein